LWRGIVPMTTVGYRTRRKRPISRRSSERSWQALDRMNMAELVIFTLRPGARFGA
jgi:hypothetical protein